MTFRAILTGLLSACLLGGLTHLNDHVIRNAYLILNSMPVASFGLVVLLFCLVNPVLRWIRPSWPFARSELAVIGMLTLVACSFLSAGLLETFPDAVMLPHHHGRIDPGWQDEAILEAVPDHFLARLPRGNTEALDAYIQGAPGDRDSLAFSDVPWGAWLATLAFWLPTAVVFMLGLVGLALVVHRQWHDHEHLPYPIARFVTDLVREDEDGRPVLLGNRVFWLGFGAVSLLLANNYLADLFPDYAIPFPTEFDLTAFSELFPNVTRGGGTGLFVIRLNFLVIGLAFLLPRDVSFSLGIGAYLYAFVIGCLLHYGVQVSDRTMGWFSPDLRMGVQAGAYTGMFLLLLYTGRHYYKAVLKQALLLPVAGDQAPPLSILGARLFLLCSVLFWGLLVFSGIDWLLAGLFTGLAYALYLVVGRIIAETGYIYIQPYWAPVSLLLAFFGYEAVGWQIALLLMFVSVAVMADTREPLIGFFLNGLAMLDANAVSVRRGARYGILAALVALLVAVPATLYFKYDTGTSFGNYWASTSIPRAPFDAAITMKRTLAGQGHEGKPPAAGGVARLLAIRPDRSAVAGFAVMLLLFLVLSTLRLRWASWPFHPVLLLVAGMGMAYLYVTPFLIGCLCKHLIVKYAGEKGYRRVLPWFIGMIAGELGFRFLITLGGAGYYAWTGVPPPR